MAPRSSARVKIVSPNSGNITCSRSASVYSTCSRATSTSTSSAMRALHNTHSSPTFVRQPLTTIDRNADCANHSSKSSSKGTHSHAHSLSLSRGRSRPEGGDQEAMQRAYNALEAAGRAVLRRPFGDHSANGTTHEASVINRGGLRQQPQHPLTTAAVAASRSDKSMQLPQSIVGLHQKRSRSRSTFADTSRESSVSSHRRPRAAAAAQPLESRNALPRLETPQEKRAFLPRRGGAAAAAPQGYPPAFSDPAAAGVPRPQPPVCPAMFSGLSAIPLSESLFAHTDAAVHPHVRGCPCPQAGTAGAGGGSESSNKRSGSDFCPRRCVRPLWSLVGTFKTALTSVVNVDYSNDCLNWQQRNPKGGCQRIRVPLHAVLDAAVVRITQEDDGIKEKQFTVIVHTTVRPSQVVFGFASTGEAHEFKRMLDPRGV